MVEQQAAGPKSFYAPLQIQNSTLLDIASEVRIAIYEAVCETTDTVIVCYRSRRRIAPIDHPLTRACRQLREEFLPIWTANAGSNSSIVVFAVKNHDIGDLGKVADRLSFLPALQENTERTYVLKLCVDNSFERSVRQDCHLRFRPSEQAKHVKFSVDVSFDNKTLDINYIHGIMRGPLVQPKLYEAFQVARAKYKSQAAEEKRAMEAAEWAETEVTGLALGWHRI